MRKQEVAGEGDIERFEFVSIATGNRQHNDKFDKFEVLRSSVKSIIIGTKTSLLLLVLVMELCAKRLLGLKCNGSSMRLFIYSPQIVQLRFASNTISTIAPKNKKNTTAVRLHHLLYHT